MKKNIAIAALAVISAVLGVLLLLPRQQAPQSCAPEAKHKAWHEGCLNAITQCENGHFEVKVTENKLEGWFVGGGQDTNRSVRITAGRVELTFFLPDGTTKELELAASPLSLAGEKGNDCSHFEGTAGWLESVKTFQALGKVFIKGKWQPLIIQYPEGYDRDLP